jgi:transcriptional regulator with PAS, ATPase and Fis domain
MLQYRQNLDWPGNIRELSNGIAGQVLVGAEANIASEPVARPRSGLLGDSNRAGNVSLKQLAKEAVRDRERNFILEALQANQWNRRRRLRL